MKKCVFSPRTLRVCVWLVLTLLTLSGYSLQAASGSVYNFMGLQGNSSAAAPDVVLEAGTAGTSTIYANNTSAKVSARANVGSEEQTTYDYVLRIANQVTDAWKIRLRTYSQSNIGRFNNCAIYFDGPSPQIYIQNGAFVNQTGSWYDLPASPAERYVVIALDASNSQVSYVYVYLEILVPNKTTYAQYIITFEIT